MSGYILCQTPLARQPYLIRNIQRNIYSLDELCWYLHHNLYLVDETIMNEELVNWLSNELALTALAGKLRGRLGKFANLEDFLYPIFKEINYLSYEELKTLGAALTVYNQQSLGERRKCAGDAFMENQRYLRAIEVYEQVLEETKPEEETPSGQEDGEEKPQAPEKRSLTKPEKLRGETLHNLGVAYARLFLMDKASEYFREAWLLTGEMGEAVRCVLAYKPGHTPIELESLLESFSGRPGVRERVDQELARFARIPETPVYSQHIDEILDRFMSDYRRSMSL